MMGILSAAQMDVVGEPAMLPEGVEWPEIRYEIDDLGDQPGFDFSAWFNQHQKGEEISSVAGFCAVVRKEGQWFSARSYYGGGHGSTAYATREEAVACIADSVSRTARFWMEKVGWKLAGDQVVTRDRWGRHTSQVVRCDGYHYTIGREPSDADYNANSVYGVFGFGGAQMAWRLIDSDTVVMGRNCWGQGRIPVEFRELLPDNAIRVVSPQEKAHKEAAAQWKAKHAATTKAIAELRASLAPFSASGREHPIPDQELMVVEDMDEDYDAQVGEVRTVTRDLDAATVMTSKYQGLAGEELWDRGPVEDDWHRPLLDLDLPAKLIPSSTEGHFHLFIDHAMRWDDYVVLLEALAVAGIVEEGYVKASIERGHTAVRMPWVKKGVPKPPPAATDEVSS